MFPRLRERLAHAFSMAPEPLAPEDERFLDELAARVVERRLVVPAMLTVDLVRHTPGMHLLFFGALPIAETIARWASLGLLRGPDDARRLARIAERREHLEVLLKKIESAAGAAA